VKGLLKGAKLKWLALWACKGKQKKKKESRSKSNGFLSRGLLMIADWMLAKIDKLKRCEK